MSQINISFNTDNAAFDEDRNLAASDIIHNVGYAILEREDLKDDPAEGKIFDPNGNAIGTWRYTP